MMQKADGAFLTIGELAEELGVPQHVLRYWETRFPELKPLQRAGNRRYYRPDDVTTARRINQLLNVEGFTVRGAQRALREPQESETQEAPPEALAAPVSAPAPVPVVPAPASPSAPGFTESDMMILLTRLRAIRRHLGEALGMED